LFWETSDNSCDRCTAAGNLVSVSHTVRTLNAWTRAGASRLHFNKFVANRRFHFNIVAATLTPEPEDNDKIRALQKEAHAETCSHLHSNPCRSTIRTLCQGLLGALPNHWIFYCEVRTLLTKINLTEPSAAHRRHLAERKRVYCGRLISGFAKATSFASLRYDAGTVKRQTA
jgi:hypothetical protein